MTDRNRRLVFPLHGKPAAAFPWIEGAWVTHPSLAQIESIDEFLGRMGQAGLANCKHWERENPRGMSWFLDTTGRLLPVLPSDLSSELRDEMRRQQAFWEAVDRRSIIHGPIHGDLFRNNVLFRSDGTLGAVLDWGFCASDQPLIYDMAIVANDWCLERNAHVLDPGKLEALRRGREKFLPLTDAEKEAWPMALRLAALRFYLSRSVDYYLPRDPNGKTLDPAHFRNIMQEHRKMASALAAPAACGLRTGAKPRPRQIAVATC